MTEPYLRRGPGQPSGTDGRRLIIGALVLLLVLIAAVVVPLLVIGLHNSGAKPPPEPSPTRSVPISTP